MGLDAVEIVMQVEEAFDIAIEDSEAEKMLTPRDIIDHVMCKVGRTDHAQCLTQRAFHLVRASLIRNAGLKRAEIKPEVLTCGLFPIGQRKELLRKTLADIGVTTFPEMVRPSWLIGLLFAVSIAVGLAASIWSAYISSSPIFILNLMASSPTIVGVIVAICCGWLAALMTRQMRYEFKPTQGNIGGLSRWVVAHGAEILGGPPGQWSREQIAERVREIVNDVLSCEKIYHEDAHFVKDLGLS